MILCVGHKCGQPLPQVSLRSGYFWHDSNTPFSLLVESGCVCVATARRWLYEAREERDLKYTIRLPATTRTGTF